MGRLLERMAAAAAARQGLDLLLASAQLECGLSDGSLRASGAEEAGAARAGLLAFSQRAASYYLALGPLPDPAAWGELRGWAGPAGQALSLSAPEGLRYYALEPAGYAQAARQWRHDHPGTPAWVIGLRSMGSLLAPVVAAALAPEGAEALAPPGAVALVPPGAAARAPEGAEARVPQSAEALAPPGAEEIVPRGAAAWPPDGAAPRLLTLRPRGAPDDRTIAAGRALEAAIRRWPGAFLIVDEGPGLSGSSFGGTVAWLAGLGVATERTGLFPSWVPAPGQLSNVYAARAWPRWRCYAAPLLAAPAGATAELSAGRWRRHWRPASPTPVWPQQERRKYLADGGRTLVKFAGFGPYQRQTLECAARLAHAGWAPPLAPEPIGEPGWIRYRTLSARPLPPRPGRRWCEWAGAYLAWRRLELVRGAARPPSATLQEMVRLNAHRLLPHRPPPPDPDPDALAAAPVAVDGRLQRGEWGLGPGGFVKFDATDHADDPFFPGPCDIAWDLAAMGIEFGAPHQAAVVAAYCRHTGETPARLALRLAWHRHAYALFRAAFARFAATQAPAADAAAFIRQSRRYLAALKQ